LRRWPGQGSLRTGRTIIALVALTALTVGCADVRLGFSAEGIDFGAPAPSLKSTPVGIILFDDARADLEDIGSFTSYLPPPVNTYRTAWVWGTLRFRTDEPLSREFTNIFAQGLREIGCPVFRSPAPVKWSESGVRELARRTGARRVVHGTIRDFRLKSNWTLASSCEMAVKLEVDVYDARGKCLFTRTYQQQSSRRLVSGEIAALVVQRQAANTFRECVESVFHDELFRRRLEVTE